MTLPSSSKKGPTSPYCAYLVRIWQEDPGAPLRASAQLVGESNIVRFATVDALFAYLDVRTASMFAPEDTPADAADDAESDGPSK